MGQMGWALIGPFLGFHGGASAASLAKGILNLEVYIPLALSSWLPTKCSLSFLALFKFFLFLFWLHGL